MKKWVLFIIKINPKLSALCRREDRYIENIALSFKGKTQEDYGEILYHSDKKIRFINLKVLYNKFCERLTDEDSKLLLAYARGECCDSLCGRFLVSKATLFRMIDKCVKKCERELMLLGFDEKRMEIDYADIFSALHKEKPAQPKLIGKTDLIKSDEKETENQDAFFVPRKQNENRILSNL